jgi:hypothetical protein
MSLSIPLYFYCWFALIYESWEYFLWSFPIPLSASLDRRKRNIGLHCWARPCSVVALLLFSSVSNIFTCRKYTDSKTSEEHKTQIKYLETLYEAVSKSFRTESITKYTLKTINTRWEATQRVMAEKLTRLTHKIAIELHLVAESYTICRSRSRRSVRELLDTPFYSPRSLILSIFFYIEM